MRIILVSVLASGLVGELPVRRDTIRLSPGTVERLGVKVEPARVSSRPGSVVLEGSLAIDPAHVARVRPRFHGVVSSIGTTDDPQGKPRPIRPGDVVGEGKILAVVWSSELSERKNQLLDALLRLRLERETFKRIEDLRTNKVVSAQAFENAKRELESAEIEVAHVERSLRARGSTAEEIKVVEAEAERVRQSNQRSPFDPEHSWARFTVKAPIEGKVIESRASLDDLVEPDETLFLLADLRRLTVRVKVREADLAALDALPMPIRWTLRPKYRPEGPPLESVAESIEVLIDPDDHTAALSGHVENRDGRLRPGQSVSATLELPPDPAMVEVPDSSRLHSEGRDWVFVQPDPETPTFRLRPVRAERLTPGFLTTRNDPEEGLKPGERVVVRGVIGLKDALDGAESRPESER